MAVPQAGQRVEVRVLLVDEHIIEDHADQDERGEVFSANLDIKYRGQDTGDSAQHQHADLIGPAHPVPLVGHKEKQQQIKPGDNEAEVVQRSPGEGVAFLMEPEIDSGKESGKGEQGADNGGHPEQPDPLSGSFPDGYQQHAQRGYAEAHKDQIFEELPAAFEAICALSEEKDVQEQPETDPAKGVQSDRQGEEVQSGKQDQQEPGKNIPLSQGINRQAHRQNPDAQIVVMGCFAQVAASERERIPGVTLVLGNDRKALLPSMLPADGGNLANPGNRFNKISQDFARPDESWKSKENLQDFHDFADRRENKYYKLSAGWLIDKAGWKGRTQGRAGVWPKNALVLYNAGGCSGDEVRALAAAIQQDVKQKFGVALDPEAIII